MRSFIELDVLTPEPRRWPLTWTRGSDPRTFPPRIPATTGKGCAGRDVEDGLEGLMGGRCVRASGSRCPECWPDGSGAARGRSARPPRSRPPAGRAAPGGRRWRLRARWCLGALRIPPSDDIFVPPSDGARANPDLCRERAFGDALVKGGMRHPQELRDLLPPEQRPGGSRWHGVREPRHLQAVLGRGLRLSRFLRLGSKAPSQPQDLVKRGFPVLQELAECSLAGVEPEAVDDVGGHGAPRVADGEGDVGGGGRHASFPGCQFSRSPGRAAPRPGSAARAGSRPSISLTGHLLPAPAEQSSLQSGRPHQQKARHMGGLSTGVADYCLRLRVAARPARPSPRRAMVPGSGTVPLNCRLSSPIESAPETPPARTYAMLLDPLLNESVPT